MSKLKLDIRQFEHVSSDDKMTTLRNKQGHEIRVLRSALEGDMRKQMDELAKAKPSKEPVKEPKTEASETEEPQMMASGGYIDELIQQDKPMMTENPDAVIQLPPQSAVARENQVLDSTGPAFLQSAPGDTPLDHIKNGIKSLGNMITPDDPRIQQGMADYTARNNAAGNLFARPGQAAQSAGALGSDSATPGGPEAQGLAPETMAALEPQALPQTSGGMGQLLGGINAEAKTRGDLGNAMAKEREQHANVMQELESNYQADAAKLNDERQALQQDIQAGYVDPEKYWTGDKDGNGGHSKLAAGIGMIIAGFNPTNNPNAAINFLKSQMENNLKAQQMNLDSKHNLLRANLQQFGNLKDATTMTRAMQNDMMANKLEMEAAKAQTPMAKAQAMKAAGMLRMEADKASQGMAQQRAVSTIISAARKDPSKIPAVLDALEQSDPKRAAELRQLHVPGMGFASSNEGAKGVREMASMVSTVSDDIKKLKEIAKRDGKSLTPKTIAEADSIRTGLIGKLRVPITGPGAMSDGEREMLQGLIPDVTAIFALDSSNKKRLDTLDERVKNSFANMAETNGLTVPQGMRPAPEVKTFEGRKYQKTTGGWKLVK